MPENLISIKSSIAYLFMNKTRNIKVFCDKIIYLSYQFICAIGTIFEIVWQKILHMKRVVLFIIIVVSIQLFFLSCQSNNNREEKENFEFYYFPKKNVYYNVEKKNFLYSLDGGKTWDSVLSVTDKEPQTLGEKIIVYSANSDVYKDNAAHRKLYNGVLFNIVNTDTSLASAVPEVTERKLKKRKQEGKPDEDEPIKGLKKFLNKIFGKHNKKKENE